MVTLLDGLIAPIESMTGRLSKDLQAFQRLRGRLNTEIQRTTPEVRAPQLGLPDVTDPLRRGLVEVDSLMSQAEGELIKTLQRVGHLLQLERGEEVLARGREALKAGAEVLGIEVKRW